LNIANALTVARIILSPFIILFLLLDFPNHEFYALGIFLIAAFTDIIDGPIARKRGEDSRFGASWDPLADKLLIIPPLITIAFQMNLLWLWLGAILLVLREMFMVAMRRKVSKNGLSVKAGWEGKYKMWLQGLTVVALMINSFIAPYVLWLAVFQTYFSAVRNVLRWR